MPWLMRHVRRGGARKCSGTKDVLLAASTDVELEGIDAVAEALAKQVTDRRTMGVGTRVPAWPNQVGCGKKGHDNQSD